MYALAYLFQVPLFALAAGATGHPLVIVSALLVSLNVGAAPAESSLIAHYSPARWRATAFGAKFAVALGVSALGIPLVALIHTATGGFFWLYVTLGVLAATAGAAACLLPRERGVAADGVAAPGTMPAPSEGD